MKACRYDGTRNYQSLSSAGNCLLCNRDMIVKRYMFLLPYARANVFMNVPDTLGDKTIFVVIV